MKNKINFTKYFHLNLYAICIAVIILLCKEMSIKNFDHVENANGRRETWKNKTEYFLSLTGYAVGVTSVWRFPYLCYRNGGGVFFIPYIIMLITCAIPTFFMETTLGQFSGLGYRNVFELCPIFKGVGYAIFIDNIIIVAVYNTFSSYSLLFIYYSFQETLPWSNCNNSWNTEMCIELSNVNNNTTIKLNTSIVTPADEFFHKHILHISPSIDYVGEVVLQIFIVSTISMVIQYFCLIKGLQSVGKVVYFTATFPFLVLFALLIRGVTLPGAWEGIKYYIYPKWEDLINIKTWSDAANQIIFTIGVGTGAIINMASGNDFRNNNKSDSIAVPLLQLFASFLGGFVVFSVLGYMSHQTGLAIPKVATGGSELALITYPEAISMLPLPQLWAVLFFFMLFLLGIDSIFGRLYAVLEHILDVYPNLKSKSHIVLLLICVLIHLISIIFMTQGGIYIFLLVEWYYTALSKILICITEVVIVMWIYGAKEFLQDAEFMLNKKFNWFWFVTLKYISLAVLFFMLCLVFVFSKHVTYHGVAFPDWTLPVGWAIRVLPFTYILGYIFYKLIATPGSLIDRIKINTKSKKAWGPSSRNLRSQWLLYKKENIELVNT